MNGYLPMYEPRPWTEARRIDVYNPWAWVLEPRHIFRLGAESIAQWVDGEIYARLLPRIKRAARNQRQRRKDKKRNLNRRKSEH